MLFHQETQYPIGCNVESSAIWRPGRRAGRTSRIVIRGARQVGKSTLVREFARASGLTLMAVDFERNPEGDPTLVNRGAVAEQFVGQHLLYSEAPYLTPALHYWARETRNAAAELDYVIAAGSRVVPVEVKAGATGSLRSLHQFIHEKSSGLALRFNADPPSLLRDSRKLPDGTTVRFDLLSLPLYLVGQARRLIGEAAAERSA